MKRKLRDELETKTPEIERAVEQIIGREGETATLLSRCPLNFSLRGVGFAPRQFGRSPPAERQSGNFTLLESNRTIQFNSSATILLKTKNFGGKRRAPFGVNPNGRGGKLGRGENHVDERQSLTLRVQ